MLPAFLLPETQVREGGDSPVLDLQDTNSALAHEDLLLLTLGITHIVEQESLDITIWGSSDGEEWGAKPIVTFPQKFYCGTYNMVLNLTRYTGIRFLRARWKVNRWGKGDLRPLFDLYLFAQPVQMRAAASGA